MKATTIHENGGLEVIRYEDIPDPQVGPGEVVLEVRAAALNHLDIWVRKGRPGAKVVAPHVLGSDAAGVVAEVGAGVKNFAKGDEVLINPGVSCGVCEWCLRGQQSECPSFGILGLSRPGTFAERVAVSAVNVLPKPEHLDFHEAAALPLAHLTAWRMLMSRARLLPGETVLIHGIGGGVALAGLQIAKLAGAEVIVTSSSDEKLARAKELGADHGINYKSVENVAQTVREMTSGRGVDIAFDAVGAATWPINFQAVRKAGRIVHCGITTGPAVEASVQALYWNQLTVMGSTMGSHEDFRQMIRAVKTANLKPVVDSVEPLERSKEAICRMEAGEQFGKIVLEVSRG
jgi:NADPH:quinone reductase-like Zn-dependent oxidoreductase